MEKQPKNQLKIVEVKAGRTIQTPSNTLKPKVITKPTDSQNK